MMNSLSVIASILSESDEEEWWGIDFDGTLSTYDKWRGPGHVGEPIQRSIEFVKELLGKDIAVKIFTARVANPEDAEEAREAINEFCRTHFGRIFPITNEKDPMMIGLLDDKLDMRRVEQNTGVMLSVAPAHADRWLHEVFKRPKGSVSVPNPSDNKEWSGGFMKWRDIDQKSHSYGHGDDTIAAMNQVVYGKPPLRTGGLNGCSVFAGRFVDGSYFLGHFDPIETHFDAWVPLLIRGKGQSAREIPYCPAETLIVLCLSNKESGIRNTIQKWSSRNDIFRMNLKSLEIFTYEMREAENDINHGINVVFDGEKLHTEWQPKPW
jgi:hypothetical protein